jgi:hypothetical protein
MGRGEEWDIHIFAWREVFTWSFMEKKGVLIVKS